LQKLGHQIVVAGPEGREFSSRIRDMGVAFEPTSSRGKSKSQLITSVAGTLRRKKIQILHAHHGRDYWPAILAAKLARSGVRVVLTRHLAKSPSSWASRHFLLGRCHALIAVSEFTARVLCEGVYEPGSPEAERRARPALRGDHSKIRVIYGGVDMQRFRPADAQDQRALWGLERDNFAFAVAGGFDLPRGKGQREYLKAAARIHERIPQARFLIIGRGSMEQLLREDIQQLGLAKKAWLTGQCADMAAGMNAIDCLVHPQIGTEALGLVVCEAHACGKPVIASDLDGIPEAFAAGNYGRLVPPESVDALAEAMLCEAGHPPRSREEKLEIHDRVRKQFSVETSSKRVSELYAELMASYSR
jgi:glycosyltransferase involved in cell wall biosynthesis